MTLTAYLNSQFSALQELDFFIRILVACLCGACIGFERSRRLKEAGKILLIVSHDVEFMAKTCDSVLLMAESAAERGDGYVGVISAY